MDNTTAKEILAAYRHDGADAADPRFAEALAQCARDPALKAWFDEERARDESMARALRSVRAPEGGKRALLGTATFDRAETSVHRSSRRWFGFGGLGMAALFLIGVAFFALSVQRPAPALDPAGFAMADLADAAMPFDYAAADAVALKNWLAAQGAPVPPTLPAALSAASAAGCKVFEDGAGGKISLLCFEAGGEIVHLFVFDERTRRLLDGPRGEWWRDGGWNFMAFEEDTVLLALATQGDPGAF